MDLDAEIIRDLRIGPQTALFRLLESYNKPLPIGFVCQKLAKSPRDIRNYVKEFDEEVAIKGNLGGFLEIKDGFVILRKRKTEEEFVFGIGSNKRLSK